MRIQKGLQPQVRDALPESLTRDFISRNSVFPQSLWTSVPQSSGTGPTFFRGLLRKLGKTGCDSSPSLVSDVVTLRLGPLAKITVRKSSNSRSPYPTPHDSQRRAVPRLKRRQGEGVGMLSPQGRRPASASPSHTAKPRPGAQGGPTGAPRPEHRSLSEENVSPRLPKQRDGRGRDRTPPRRCAGAALRGGAAVDPTALRRAAPPGTTRRRRRPLALSRRKTFRRSGGARCLPPSFSPRGAVGESCRRGEVRFPGRPR